jgi:hypothetical protein
MNNPSTPTLEIERYRDVRSDIASKFLLSDQKTVKIEHLDDIKTFIVQTVIALERSLRCNHIALRWLGRNC